MLEEYKKLGERTNERLHPRGLVAVYRCGDMEYLTSVKNFSLGGIYLEGLQRDTNQPKEGEVILRMSNGYECGPLPVEFVHDQSSKEISESGSGFRFKKLKSYQLEGLKFLLNPLDNVVFL